MTATVADGIVAHLKDQLDWVGPNGRPLGHIVLTRSNASFLHAHIVNLTDRVAELERSKDDHPNPR